jgi:CheY-like chemotaxis protein
VIPHLDEAVAVDVRVANSAFDEIAAASGGRRQDLGDAPRLPLHITREDDRGGIADLVRSTPGGSDGFGFRRAQLGEPAIAAIPVVWLSALAKDQVPDTLRADYLRKPVDVERLLEVVRQYCTALSSQPS